VLWKAKSLLHLGDKSVLGCMQEIKSSWIMGIHFAIVHLWIMDHYSALGNKIYTSVIREYTINACMRVNLDHGSTL